MSSSAVDVHSDASTLRAWWLPPAGLTLALLAMTALPRIRESEALTTSFFGAAGALTLLLAVTAVVLARRAQTPEMVTVVRRAHWVQACMHLCVFSYWGAYWEPVRHHAPLIVAQLVFVHAFEMLVFWLRGKPWTLGFGRFPIIFSTNLFLWFRDDVFALQFVMIAFGVLAKEYFVWTREGKRTHICNPSAISLSVASLLLLATGNTELSWGPAISNTMNLAPHMYAWIFCLGLVVQYLFGVTLVTLSAAVALMAAGALYYAATGVFFFLTSDIPIAVFLGLHLLVTDPSTSPRSNRGKAIFGALYGLSVMALFELLDAFGAPTFYDKLLAVPLLNLSVQWIDRLAARLPGSGAPFGLEGHRLNVAFMGIWVALFAAWSATGQVGASHPGRESAFWEQACQEGRRNACPKLVALLEPACESGNAIACGKVAFLLRDGRGIAPDPGRARAALERSCALGSQAACDLRDDFAP